MRLWFIGRISPCQGEETGSIPVSRSRVLCAWGESNPHHPVRSGILYPLSYKRLGVIIPPMVGLRERLAEVVQKDRSDDFVDIGKRILEISGDSPYNVFIKERLNATLRWILKRIEKTKENTGIA